MEGQPPSAVRRSEAPRGGAVRIQHSGNRYSLFLKGHGFQPCREGGPPQPALAADGVGPQGLKANPFRAPAARLKPRPFKARPQQMRPDRTRISGFLDRGAYV